MAKKNKKRKEKKRKKHPTIKRGMCFGEHGCSGKHKNFPWWGRKRVFVYAVTLAFKTNRINIMFANMKKAIYCLIGPINFLLEPLFRTQQF